MHRDPGQQACTNPSEPALGRAALSSLWAALAAVAWLAPAPPAGAAPAARKAPPAAVQTAKTPPAGKRQPKVIDNKAVDKAANKAANKAAQKAANKTVAEGVTRPALAAVAPASGLSQRLDPAVQPRAMHLALTLDPAQPRHRGSVAIDLTLARATDTITLHARELQITQAAVESGAHRLAARVQALDADRISLRTARPVPAGSARLVIDFSGMVGDKDLQGLFRQQDGRDWYLMSQFKPMGARRAFPLFDEPGHKLPWTVTLTVPAGVQAFANTPLAQQEPAELPGWQQWRFATTPPLASYQLALAVGPFDRLDGGMVGPVPLGFLAPRGRAAEAGAAAALAGRLLAQLEDDLGSPYPYAKLDHLALPSGNAPLAWEPPGLVGYTGTLLLSRPGVAGSAFERRFLAQAAPVMARQWLGNLVTPPWWDDLWLGEALVAWQAERSLAALLPDAPADSTATLARARAMRADRLAGARRLQQPLLNDDDLAAPWDPITRHKGHAVVAMTERWLGAERLRAGVRRFVERHAWGHAGSEQFFAALAVDDAQVADMVRSFSTQAGVPRLRLRLLCEPGRPPQLHLAQSRLQPLGQAAAAAPAAVWRVPVVLRTPAGLARVMMDAPEGTLPLPDTSCPAWVQANVGGLGYYRVAYPRELLARLLSAPQTSAAELIALADDARGLHEAGEMSSTDATVVALVLARHPQAAVAEAAADLLRHLQPLADGAARGAYSALWQRAFGARARALGFSARSTDSDDDRRWRQQLLPLVAELGEDAGLRAQALGLARQWLADRAALPAEQRGAVLASAALQGDAALFDAYAAALKTSTDRQERSQLWHALGHFRVPALAERARELLLEPGLDPREGLETLLRAQTADAADRRAALDFIARYQGGLARRMDRQAPARWPELFDRACGDDDAQRLRHDLGPTAARHPGGRATLAATLESAALCGAWRAHHGPLPVVD